MSQTDSIMLAVPVNERDHVTGPANAPLTVVNYGDYQCPGCQKTHRSTEKLARELLDRVRLVHRHFPLVKSHPRALRAAEAAEAAAAQGKFWEMHRLLYLHPDKLGDRDLHRYGNEEFYFSLNHGITGTAKLVAFINVFRVEPANQQRLVDLLARVTVESVRHAPGFVSATLLRSFDGAKVTMYAQWRTIEDYQTMRNNPASRGYLQQALAIARFEPGMYEIVESYLPNDNGT